LTNVRSRFNDWMFKVLLFLVPFLFVPLLSSRVSAAATDLETGGTANITWKMGSSDVNPGDSVTYDGTDKTPVPTVKFTPTDGSETTLDSTHYTVTYTDDATPTPNPLTADNIINAQTIKVKISGDGTNYTGDLGPYEFTITPKPLTEATVSGIADVTYDGDDHTPNVSVTDGTTPLASGDYEVKYYAGNVGVLSGNIKDAATFEVRITGKGNYSGSISKKFTIQQAEIKSSWFQNIDKQLYTGSEIKPPINKTTAAPTTLDENIDYTVSYKNNTNAGEATVIVEGKGNYTGKHEDSFIITPASATISDVKASDIIYGQTLSESKIKGTATKADGTTIDGTFSFKDVDPSTTKPTMKDEKDPKDFDTDPYAVKFVSSDGNYEGTGTVTLKVRYWGTMKTEKGMTYWVDSNGMTSTQVKENGSSWLQEASEGSFATYGLENPKKDGKPLFEPGSRFWVRWISHTDSDWNEVYAKIDDKYKNDVDSGRLYVFEAGVTKPDGTPYEELDIPAYLYVQIGSDWTEDDIKAMRVLSGNDDDVKVEASFVASDSITGCPITDGKFAKLSLNHFSIFGFYDPFDPVSASSIDVKDSNKDTSTNDTDLAELLGIDSSNKKTSSFGTTSPYGLGSSLYKSTGDTDEEKNAYLIPMFLPILLFVLIYEKKRLNKVL